MGKLAKNRVVDEHASQLASGFRAPDLVAVGKIFPIVDVTTESGKFMTFGADASVIRTGLERALGDDRKRIDMRVGTGSFNTAEVGLEIPLYDRELKNVPESRRQDYRDKKTLIVQRYHLLGMEYGIASIIRAAGSYDVNHTLALAGTSRWSDPASTPYRNLRDWLRIQSFALGVPVSALSVALAPKPWESLQDHAQTLDRVKYTGKEASPEWLAAVLSCKSIDLLNGMYASSFDPKDPSNVTFSNIYDDEVIVYLEIANPSVGDPLWGGVARVDGYPVVTEYRDEPKSADVIASDENYGIFVQDNKRGFLARTVTGLP
jgi:hypothetical protein